MKQTSDPAEMRYAGPLFTKEDTMGSGPKSNVTVAEQSTLAPLPDSVEQEETELEGLINRTTQQALAKLPSVTDKEIERIINARAALIKTVRAVAIKMTHPHDWTLYKARDGSVVGVPAAAACLVIRRWAGISIRNHRGIDGRPGVPTRSETTNSKNEAIFVLEMLADGFWGQNVLPDMESVPANLRSDDDFTGRTKRDERYGGPRPEDLSLSLRTTLDSKVVRAMLGITKVTEEELKALGLDTAKCTKGSGFGTASERAAGAVAEQGVPEMAKALWDEIVKRTGGNLGEAKQLLVDITKRAADPKKEGDKGFRGFDSWERFTKAWQIENAAKALAKHEVFGDRPEGE